MKAELEKQLVEKYPKILQDYRGDKMVTCMHWGLECGEGWYELLDKCMEKLQYFCDLCLYKNGVEVQIVANQIKEKFGTLRFYYTTNQATDVESRIIDNIVSAAEQASERTCEVTGKDGNLCVKGGWYKTLCYEEARKQQYKASDPDLEGYWQFKDEKKDQNDDNKSR